MSVTHYFFIMFISFLLCPKKTFMWRYAFGVLYLVDCLANAAILLGDYRETISSRVGKAYLRGVKWIIPVRLLIDFVFLLVERNGNHCVRMIQADVGDKTILRWN